VTLFLTRIHVHPEVAISLSRCGIIDGVVDLDNIFESLEEADWVLDLGGATSNVDGMTPGADASSVRSMSGMTHAPSQQVLRGDELREEEDDNEHGYWPHGGYIDD
jgi:hypothetical protein